MTLIESLKSGKRFRRPGFPWIEVNGPNINYAAGTKSVYYLNASEVLAEDWEIESTPVTITKEQFWDAYDSAVSRKAPSCESLNLVTEMAERLGLG